MWRPGSDEKLDVNLVDESELIDIQMTEISSDHSYSIPRCSDVCTRWLLNTCLSIAIPSPASLAVGTCDRLTMVISTFHV